MAKHISPRIRKSIEWDITNIQWILAEEFHPDLDKIGNLDNFLFGIEFPCINIYEDDIRIGRFNCETGKMFKYFVDADVKHEFLSTAITATMYAAMKRIISLDEENFNSFNSHMFFGKL